MKSPDGSWIAAAADRDWHFKLTVGQWMKLQAAFGNIGPLRISEHFDSEGNWKIEDVREVIERGLEGGGMAAADARPAATEIVDGQPLNASYQLVVDIIGASWAGMDDLLKKKAIIEKATAALSKMPMDGGSSTTSSAVVSLPESSHQKPKSSVSGNFSQ